MANLIQLLLFFSLIYAPVIAINKTVCDCSRPQTKGLLDLDPPPYCKHKTNDVHFGNYAHFEKVTYDILTRAKPDISWPAYSCSQWHETKTVTGSFWVGSYDTVYTTTTLEVSPSECWRMVGAKCGDNKMDRNGGTLSYTKKPTGEGYWYSVTKYQTLNCIVHEIKLSQEGTDDIISPFGIIKTNVSNEQSHINHNTIVWKKTDVPVAKAGKVCDLTIVFSGTGRISVKNGTADGRLVDPRRQLETLFDTQKVTFCLNHKVHLINGMPDTFLRVRSPEYHTHVSKTKREVTLDVNDQARTHVPINNETKRALDEGMRIHGISYSWGPLVSKKQANGRPCALTSHDEEMPLTAITLLNDQERLSSTSNQDFVHVIDQTIRVQNTNLCVTADTNSYITIRHCSRETSRWIHDYKSDLYIEEQSLLCLTQSTPSVLLSVCDIDDDNQKWQHAEVNINPIIHETHPKLTLEDVKLSKSEFTENPVSVEDTNINSSYNWGQLYTKHNDARYCITAKGPREPLIMASCKSNNLKIDPSQYFELTANYTIRQFKTNNCINSFTSNSVLLPCDSTSQIWGKNFLTGQLMNRNMRCLEHDNANVFLDMCDFNLQNQHWKFAFYNPQVDNQFKAILTSAQIVTMHTNPSVTTEQLEFLLPTTITNNQENLNDRFPVQSTTHKREAGVERNDRMPGVIDVYEDGQDGASPVARLNISEFNKQFIHPLHEQFKQGLQVDHENKLAAESRQLYCEIAAIKKAQAISLSQTNGILAAAALDLPVCTRLKGLGQTILLQQCAPKSINISAIETDCGFQPYFSYNNMKNTIGIDGWSIHPFSECFWKSQYVTLNGETYKWKKLNKTWDWVKQDTTIHYSNLELISKFKEVKLNDFNYELKAHPAHNLNDLENINVLTDLIGHIENSNSDALTDIVISRQQNTNLAQMFNWSDKLKPIITVVFSLIFILFLLKVISYYCRRSPSSSNNVSPLRRVRVTRLDSAERENSPHESVHMLDVTGATPVRPKATTRDPLSLARELLTFKTFRPTPTTPPPTSQLAQSETSSPQAELATTHNETSTVLIEPSPPAGNIALPEVATPPATPVPCKHTHTTCTYVVGRGLVWEDLCPCGPTTADISIEN